jgi:translation initiation factor IF-2
VSVRPRRLFSSAAAAATLPPRDRSVALPPDELSTRGLAAALGVREEEVSALLVDLGEEAVDADALLDFEVAQLLALEHGVSLSLGAPALPGANADAPDAARADAEGTRPAVVAILGHVDHGKTSILDALRSARVAAGEAGGITQRIGAFGALGMTWIDTPGHALFSAMRARGAALTDVALLVVAADQGAQEQTAEAIRHIRAAGVPFVVGLNKMDKPGADAHKARLSLLEYGVVAEELGGDVPTVELSATKRTGLAAMCELLQLQAELLELRPHASAPVAGSVLESDVSVKRGVVATVLLSHGTLRTGDIVVAGMAWGRVRTMTADDGRLCKAVTAGVPVQLAGLKDVPKSGDRVVVVASERRARQLVDARVSRAANEAGDERRAARRARTLARTEALGVAGGAAGSAQPLAVPISVKAESSGGLDAIISALATIPAKRAQALVVSAAVGQLTEADVELAETCGAALVGYNVTASPRVRSAAASAGVRVSCSPIIYTLLDEAREILRAALPPDRTEERIGRAEVLDTFVITANAALQGKGAPKRPVVGGMRIVDGSIKSSAHLRVVRRGEVVHEAEVLSIRHFKEDVSEIAKGNECGVILHGGWDGWERGDEVISINYKESEPSLE